jgi:peroxiredoxin
VRLIGTIGGMLVAGSLAGAIMVQRAPAAIAADGELPPGNGLVVLEPGNWTGKTFVLQRYIDIGPQLAIGEWVVMLYHADCSECREAIPLYAKLAARASAAASSPRFALVEMPEYGQLDEPADLSSCVRGKLSNQREWFATTPVVLRLSNGRVVDEADGKDALARIKSALVESDDNVSPLKGQRAPDFTLRTDTGEVVRLSQYKGDVIVLDFWATWCGPCRMSLPHLQILAVDAERRGRGLRVLALNLGESPETVTRFMQEEHYTFTALMDSARDVGAAFSVDAIPATFVVGRDGVVKGAFLGCMPQTLEAIDQAVDKALGEPPR